MEIDPKYCTKTLGVLTEVEILLETKSPKTTTSIELFAEDLKLAQELKINVSRIIRHKFHEWLLQKVH